MKLYEVKKLSLKVLKEYASNDAIFTSISGKKEISAALIKSLVTTGGVTVPSSLFSLSLEHAVCNKTLRRITMFKKIFFIFVKFIF